jgi:hypothetical protein
MVTKLFEKIYSKEHQEMEQTCFSLSIQQIESDPIDESFFWIMSDVLPEEMLEDFNTLISPKLIYTTQKSDPNHIYMEELLDFIALQILADPAFNSFFYPEFFFNRNHSVQLDVCRKFNEARTDVRNGNLTIINRNNPLHLYYLHQLIRVPKRFLNEKKYSVERISRQHFESSIIDFQRAEEYVEIFSKVSRFKLIRDRQKNPEYYLAVDAWNQPLLAITAVVED